MNIKNNLEAIRAELPENVKLIAVSKTKPVSMIMEAYEAGQKVFGENKAQDMAAKYPQLPADIEWHFIGHMQTNKVKYIAPFVKLIHSADSFKVLKEINKQALKNKRTIDTLLQFHIATEETKFGLNMEEAAEILTNPEFENLKNVRICGVMGMATFTDDEQLIRKEFKTLKNTFVQLKNQYFKNKEYFKEISMGMSGDYKIAVEEGSTMVRIGTKIFGARNVH